MVFGIFLICLCDSVFQKALFWDFQNFFRRRIQFKTQNFRAWKNRITRTNINYAKLQEFLKYCKFHSTGIKWNLMIWKVIKNSKADHKYATEITSGVEGLSIFMLHQNFWLLWVAVSLCGCGLRLQSYVQTAYLGMGVEERPICNSMFLVMLLLGLCIFFFENFEKVSKNDFE